MIWPGPESFHRDQPALELASSVLSDGLSARLGRTLVYDRQLCSNVTAFNNSSEIAGAYMVIATIRQGVKRELVEEVIAKELAKLARLGPSVKELRRAKAKWEFDFVSGLERIG
jgi:zinc protease